MANNDECFYVLQCVDLFIKNGGFIYDIREALQFATVKKAEKARVSGWKVVKVTHDTTIQ